MATPLQHIKGLSDKTHRQLTQEILRALQDIRYGSVDFLIPAANVRFRTSGGRPHK